MTVNPDVDGYDQILNQPKILQKRKNGYIFFVRAWISSGSWTLRGKEAGHAILALMCFFGEQRSETINRCTMHTEVCDVVCTSNHECCTTEFNNELIHGTSWSGLQR